jgi:hypothetical protein
MKHSVYRPVLFSSLLAILAWSACSSPQTADTTRSPMTTEPMSEVAADSDASYYTEINYEKGSARLEQKDYKAISDLIQKSMREGKIDEIKVITFADKPYPNSVRKRLSSEQRKIADSRNEQINQFLKDTYPSLEVNTYNMASRPGVMQELFKTSDAMTKKSYEEAGMASIHSPEKGAPELISKSIVMSVVKRSY